MGDTIMICKRCEQWIPENSRHEAKIHCKHCFNAILYGGNNG
jgi:hypothetical protein